jgi:hypothetical protein
MRIKSIQRYARPICFRKTRSVGVISSIQPKVRVRLPRHRRTRHCEQLRLQEHLVRYRALDVIFTITFHSGALGKTWEYCRAGQSYVS